MIAAFYGRMDFIKELRARGASYEIRDITGMTPIFYAVDGGHLTALEWMLTDGADVNVVAHNGWTPLLRAASVNGAPDIARTLIRYGADVNAVDKKNKNALLTATINGNVPFVKVLLENGANFRFKNKFGKTMYDLAISMDRKVRDFQYQLLVNEKLI
jgi:ankyrin repeat protein